MNTFLLVIGIFMLICGFALVVLEMYLPGFGIPGISGIALLIGGIIVMKPSPMQAVLMALGILLLLAIALTVSVRSAAKGRFAKSKLVLNDVSNNEEKKSDLTYLVGKEGVARTALRPTGMADFDGVKLNVITDGEFIEPDEKVKIVRVDGNRILVTGK